jgi:nucleotide-binding universal stress UspA family protein
MISKIVVASNDSPEAQRAHRAEIELARACKAELATVSIPSDLTAYTSFAIVVDPEAPNVIREVQRRTHGELHKKASRLAQEDGVRTTGSVVKGREIQALLHFLIRHRADHLLTGFHRHGSYLSRLRSPVYDLAQGAPCSLLDVH